MSTGRPKHTNRKNKAHKVEDQNTQTGRPKHTNREKQSTQTGRQKSLRSKQPTAQASRLAAERAAKKEGSSTETCRGWSAGCCCGCDPLLPFASKQGPHLDVVLLLILIFLDEECPQLLHSLFLEKRGSNGQSLTNKASHFQTWRRKQTNKKETERERTELKLKTLFYKDCSLGSVKNLTTSPC